MKQYKGLADNDSAVNPGPSVHPGRRSEQAKPLRRGLPRSGMYGPLVKRVSVPPTTFSLAIWPARLPSEVLNYYYYY